MKPDCIFLALWFTTCIILVGISFASLLIGAIYHAVGLLFVGYFFGSIALGLNARILYLLLRDKLFDETIPKERDPANKKEFAAAGNEVFPGEPNQNTIKSLTWIKAISLAFSIVFSLICISAMIFSPILFVQT